MYQTKGSLSKFHFILPINAPDKCTSTAVRNKNKIACAGYRSDARDTRIFDKI